MLFAKSELFSRMDKPGGLEENLQTAIALEHATLPPYLTALYSLKSSANEEVRARIKEVMMEEMLHMTLACNLLVSIGGSPKLANSNFIPSYPSDLPGTHNPDFKVPIRSFSRDLVEQVFMKIEQPLHPLKFRSVALLEERQTIGQFYRALQLRFESVPQSTFDMNKDRKQVEFRVAGIRTQQITNAAQAKAVIELIVDQGEGTEVSPSDPVAGGRDGNYAHYYKFEEIARQRQLIKNPTPNPSDPNSNYIFDGDEIVVNEATEVFTMLDTPKRQTYEEMGEAEALAKSDAFNKQYTQLLIGLEACFNGQPELMSNLAHNTMPALADAATALFATKLESRPGYFAGPTFEWMQ
jgi:rubrerythrin